MANNLSFNDYLLQSTHLTTRHLALAGELAEVEHKTLPEALLAGNFISERELIHLMSRYYDLPFVSLIGKKIDQDIIELIPPKLAKSHQVIAFDKNGKNVKIASVNPQQDEIIHYLSRRSLTPKLYLTQSRDLHEAYIYYSQEKIDSTKQDLAGEIADFLNAKNAAPLIEKIILLAYKLDAVSVTLNPSDKNIGLFFRINGIIKQLATLPFSFAEPLALYFQDQLLSFEKTHRAGILKFQHQQKIIKVAFHISKNTFGETYSLNLHPCSQNPPSFSLIFPSYKSTQVLDSFSRPQGLIILAAPTAHHLDAIYYSLLEKLTRTEMSITSVEDDSVYSLPGTNQISLDPLGGLDAASVLEQTLRQDNDLIALNSDLSPSLIHEIVQAAASGQLILSGVTANCAFSALRQFLSASSPHDFAHALNGVIALHPLKKVCPHCLEHYTPPLKAVTSIFSLLGSNQFSELLSMIHARESGKLHLVRGRGCDKCQNTGYLGMVYTSEIIPIDHEMEQEIVNSVSVRRLRALALNKGQETLLSDAFRLALAGKTTLEQVLTLVTKHLA